jgi:hypothetical protein
VCQGLFQALGKSMSKQTGIPSLMQLIGNCQIIKVQRKQLGTYCKNSGKNGKQQTLECRINVT